MSKTVYQIVAGVLFALVVLMYFNNQRGAEYQNYLLQRIATECPNLQEATP